MYSQEKGRRKATNLVGVRRERRRGVDHDLERVLRHSPQDGALLACAHAAEEHVAAGNNANGQVLFFLFLALLSDLISLR